MSAPSQEVHVETVDDLRRRIADLRAVAAEAYAVLHEVEELQANSQIARLVSVDLWHRVYLAATRAAQAR